MKVGIVPARLIAAEGRLDADHYLLPTAAKEQELARKKKALVSRQTAVDNLETEMARAVRPPLVPARPLRCVCGGQQPAARPCRRCGAMAMTRT